MSRSLDAAKMVLLALFAAAASGLFAPSPAIAQRATDYAEAREAMVDLISDVVKDERVRDALRRTERHLFVSSDQRKSAYLDMALPIGNGATISPPAVVGFMTEQLHPQPTDRVLEIGTGSGYQAAVLSPLVADVYTIEIVEPLGKKAASRLELLGYENIHCKIGDGYAGWPEHAPFDKIIVTCSPDKIPQPLIDQLRDGGQMVIPLGDRFQQSMCLVTKNGNELKREVLESTFFIPMTGRAEELRDNLSDEATPQLANGGFEELTSRGLPFGWYYLRQAELVTGDEAHRGERTIRFSSESTERTAHALQAFGVDGRKFREMVVSLDVEIKNVTAGGQGTFAGVDVRFYDEKRNNVGGEQLGPWTGSRDWSKQSKSIRVPPRARLAVLGIGLFGATGEIRVDDVEVRPAP